MGFVPNSDELSVEHEKESYRSKGFIRPDGKFRTTWELVMLVFTFYCAFAIPLYIAWGITRHDIGYWIYFENAMDVCFMLDVVFNFRTG